MKKVSLVLLVALMLSGFVGKSQQNFGKTVIKGESSWGILRIAPEALNGERSIGFYRSPTGAGENVTETTWVLGVGGWGSGNNFVLGYGAKGLLYKFNENGTATASSWSSSSDLRFKTNILPFNSMLQKVMSLQPVTYNWKVNEFTNRGFANDLQIGFIAQDVQKLFPELVTTGTDGYLSLDYAKVTPILVKALQEQQVLIEKLSGQIVEMKASIEDLQLSKTKTSKR